MISARSARVLLVSPCGIGVVLVVVALLSFANVSQSASEASHAFHQAMFADHTTLYHTLSARSRDMVGTAITEYVSLVVGLAGACLTVFGPLLGRARVRRNLPKPLRRDARTNPQ